MTMEALREPSRKVRAAPRRPAGPAFPGALPPEASSKLGPILPAGPAVFAAVLVAVLVVGCGRDSDSSSGGAGGDGSDADAARSATLYFPAPDGQLASERRDPDEALGAEARRRWLVEELLAGPRGERLAATWPWAEGTSIANLYASPEGRIYVDLTLPDGNAPGMGSTEELLAIYSLVNTILLDEPRTSEVVLLFNGRQRASLAGHVDVSRPLAARRDLVPADAAQ